MHRRRLLGVVGSTLLAGCGAPGERTTPTGTPTSGDGSLPDSRFAGQPCPSLRGTTTCHHTTSRDEPYLALVPGSERTTRAEFGIPFTLHNESGLPFQAWIPAWQLAKRTPDGWQRLPFGRQDSMGMERVPDGETLRFGVGAAGDYRIDPTLGPGVFAFGVYGTFGESGAAQTPAALFEVVGDPLEVAPGEAAVSRRDGRLVVTPSERVDHGRITVSFATTSGDGKAVPPELVVKSRGLRAALPRLHREDVSELLLQTEDRYFRTPPEWLRSGVGEGPYDYRGTVFSVGQQEGWAYEPGSGG